MEMRVILLQRIVAKKCEMFIFYWKDYICPTGIPWKEREKSNLWKDKDSTWKIEEPMLDHTKIYFSGTLSRCQIKPNELNSVWSTFLVCVCVMCMCI
jgi:hypothetical protein